MKAYLIAAYKKLLTEEKALFKSATMWLAGVLATAPDTLAYAQQQFPSLQPYLPHVLQAQGMKWIALAIFVCRIRSMLPKTQA